MDLWSRRERLEHGHIWLVGALFIAAAIASLVLYVAGCSTLVDSLKGAVIEGNLAIIKGKAEIDKQDGEVKQAILKYVEKYAVEVCLKRPVEVRAQCVTDEGNRLHNEHVANREKAVDAVVKGKAVLDNATAAIPLIERGLARETEAQGYVNDALGVALSIGKTLAVFDVFKKSIAVPDGGVQ